MRAVAHAGPVNNNTIGKHLPNDRRRAASPGCDERRRFCGFELALLFARQPRELPQLGHDRERIDAGRLLPVSFVADPVQGRVVAGRAIASAYNVRHIMQPDHSMRPSTGVGPGLFLGLPRPRRGASDRGRSPHGRSGATSSSLAGACTVTGSACSISRVCPQSLRATSSGSIPVAFHQPGSLPTRCKARWWRAAERHHEFVADLAAERALPARSAGGAGRTACGRRSGRAAGRRTAGAPCCGGAWARRVRARSCRCRAAVR